MALVLVSKGQATSADRKCWLLDAGSILGFLWLASCVCLGNMMLWSGLKLMVGSNFWDLQFRTPHA